MGYEEVIRGIAPGLNADQWALDRDERLSFIAEELSHALDMLLTRKNEGLTLSAEEAKTVFAHVWNVEASLYDLGLCRYSRGGAV